jgi:tRNA-splicing ligase RtcB
MPDAHVGYGLPIGGVLAVSKAVIPYAVGVDIACRMRLTVLDWPAANLAGRRADLRAALENETRFGLGAAFGPGERREHQVMDEDWSVSPVTARLKDRAWKQLGTSGGGNHFVEFGELVLPAPDLGLPAGEYLALLSHSGSRGPGEEVAGHYSRLAMDRRPGLPPEIKHLAWLEEDSEPGLEYWAAMELMGRYAAAGHDLIHRHILAALKAEPLAAVENHHNVAWREAHEGREVIVHRKGATPADRGRLGLIPGSMGSPGFVVRGRGCPEALFSCSHGAGRRLSRAAAFKTLDRAKVTAYLAERGVELISGGLDEAPMAYKDIEAVMAAQADLVDIVARFTPRLVKMAPGGDEADPKARFRKKRCWK